MFARLRRRWTQQTLVILAIALLAIVLVYPVALTVRGALVRRLDSGEEVFTLRHVAAVLADPVLLEGLGRSILVATCTTAIAILIALPLALIAARRRFPGVGVWNALVLLPFILPPFVGAIGMQAILGRAGALNTLLGTDFDPLGRARFWGVVVVEALHLYPIVYLNLTAALASLDPALDEAAETLGARPWTRFRRVTLPLIRPGLFAGGIIVFIWSLTELGTPLMFSYAAVTPVQIFDRLKEVEHSAEPYALTLVLLVMASGLYLLGRALAGRRGHAMSARAVRSADRRPLGPIAALAATALFALVTALAILPHVGVVLQSVAQPGQWYRSLLPTAYTASNFEQALTAPESFRAITNSLKLSALAVAVDIALGLTVAYLLVRTRAIGRGLLDLLCMMPLVVPGLVMAFGYIAVTLRWPFAAGAPLDGTWLDLDIFGAAPNPFPLLVIAYAVRRLPYIVRAAVAGLESTSGELEDAAITLGASRLTAVRRVTVPLIAANLVAGSLMVFSFSMLEVSDSLILAQHQAHAPITRAIFEFMGRLGDGPSIASAMGVWGMALLAVTLVAGAMLMGRRLGAVFRV